MNGCKHEGSDENRKAIYYYYYPSAEAGFAQLQQNGINTCMEKFPTKYSPPFLFIAKAFECI